MIKIILSLFCLSVFFIPVVSATTPSNGVMFPVGNLSLTYDLNKTSLHIEASHPSQNWEIDYVRMMTVSLNGQEVSTQNYYHQTGIGFSDDISLNAKEGDVITVTLYATGGNSVSKDLTVTSAPVSKTDPGTDTNTDTSTTNSTADNAMNVHLSGDEVAQVVSRKG